MGGGHGIARAACACSTSACGARARTRRSSSPRSVPTSSRWSLPAATRCAATRSCSPASTPTSAASCSTSSATRTAARALELAADADVLVEGFRPGVAARLGVGYEDVRAVAPSIVYCSVSGMGQTGPFRLVPGHDLNYQAWAGALAPEGGTPEVSKLPIADLAGGMAAAFAICAAVVRRQRTGDGEHIDVAMTDVLATWTGAAAPRTSDAESSARGVPGYGLFATAGGAHLTLGVLTREPLLGVAVRRARAGGRARADLRRAHGARRRVAVACCCRHRARADRDELVDELLAADVPVAPVLDRAEMLALEHLRERVVATVGSLGRPVDRVSGALRATCRGARRVRRLVSTSIEVRDSSSVPIHDDVAHRPSHAVAGSACDVRGGAPRRDRSEHRRCRRRRPSGTDRERDRRPRSRRLRPRLAREPRLHLRCLEALLRSDLLPVSRSDRPAALRRSSSTATTTPPGRSTRSTPSPPVCSGRACKHPSRLSVRRARPTSTRVGSSGRPSPLASRCDELPHVEAVRRKLSSRSGTTEWHACEAPQTRPTEGVRSHGRMSGPLRPTTTERGCDFRRRTLAIAS